MQIVLNYDSLRIPFTIQDHAPALKWAALVWYYYIKPEFYLERQIFESLSKESSNEVRAKIFSNFNFLASVEPGTFDFTLHPDKEYSQTELNALHTVYERTIVDEAYFLRHKTRAEAIRAAWDELNRDIHIYEGQKGATRTGTPTTQTHTVDYRFIEASSKAPNVRKILIEDNELTHFVKFRRPGYLHLRYCITGKGVRDTYLTGQPCDEAHPQRHLSPAFSFQVASRTLDEQRQEWDKVHRWLEESGYDPSSPYLCLGWVELAYTNNAESFALSPDELKLVRTRTPVIEFKVTGDEQARLEQTLINLMERSPHFSGADIRRISQESLARAKR